MGGSHTRREAAHRQGVTKHFKKQALSWRVHSCTCVSTRVTGCRTCVRACEVQVCWRICCMFTCVCRHVGIVHVCGCRGPMEGRAEPGFLEKVPECKDIVSPWPLPGGDQDLPPARTSVHPKTHATAAASPGASLSRARAGAVALVKGPAPAPSPSRSGRSPDSLHPRPGPWAASRGPPGLRAPAREQDPGHAQAHFWGALWVPSSPRAAAHAPAATRPGWNSLLRQGHSRSTLSSTSPPKTPRPAD